MSREEALVYVREVLESYVRSQSPYELGYEKSFVEELNALCSMIARNDFGEDVLDTILECSKDVHSEDHRDFLFICIYEVLYEDPIWSAWGERLERVKSDGELQWIDELWLKRLDNE